MQAFVFFSTIRRCWCDSPDTKLILYVCFHRYDLDGKRWSAKIVRRVDDCIVFVQDITTAFEAEQRLLIPPRESVEAVAGSKRSYDISNQV
jgi:hypothetical protein